MRLPITAGRTNPILRAQSKPVGKITKEIKKLLRDMEETMFLEEGVGIAAPQVGVNLHMAIMLLSGKQVVPIINPRVLSHSEDMSEGEEGCLSLRGDWGKVPRYEQVTIGFTNVKGETVTLKLSGFNARIAQHEIDHLNGVLFVDHVK